MTNITSVKKFPSLNFLASSEEDSSQYQRENLIPEPVRKVWILLRGQQGEGGGEDNEHTQAGKDEGDGGHAEQLAAWTQEHRQQHPLPAHMG